MNTMTREQMIEAIYQIVTPSIEVFKPNNDGTWQNVIMIGDVLDWWDKNYNIFNYKFEEIIKGWYNKREPIENQSDDCIKFVFDNLNIGQ